MVSNLQALEFQAEASHTQPYQNKKGKKIVLRNLHL